MQVFPGMGTERKDQSEEGWFSFPFSSHSSLLCIMGGQGMSDDMANKIDMQDAMQT